MKKSTNGLLKKRNETIAEAPFLEEFSDYVERMEVDLKWALARTALTGDYNHDYPDKHIQMIRHFNVQEFCNEKCNSIMTSKEYAYLQSLPNEIIIYRGGGLPTNHHYKPSYFIIKLWPKPFDYRNYEFNPLFFIH